MRIVYTAFRSIIPTHVANDPYELIIGARAFDPRKQFFRNTTRAIDRSFVSDLNAIRQEYRIVTHPVDAALYDTWMEFIDSVANFETFVVDLDSNEVGVDVNPRQVFMVDRNVSPRRVLTTGKFRFSFTVEEL